MSRSSVASRLSSAASSAKRLADLPFLAATRDALPWGFGALFAAFIVILPFVHEAGPVFGPSLGLRVSGALLPAFGIMGVVLAPAVAWRLAVRARIDPSVSAGGCLAAYALLLPAPHGPALAYLRAVGPSGLFVALAIGGVFASVALTMRSAWVGTAVVLLIAGVLRVEHVSVEAMVSAMLSPLGRLGDTYAALMTIVLIETLLWTIGLHGPALLAAVVTPVYLTLQMQNTQAYAHHVPLPNIVVVSLFLFIFPGGAGATLPLAALLALSRVPRLRTIGRIAIVPGIFNANEPLIFGAPVVLNPFLIPPFVVVPLILATTTYGAVALGWVGRPIYYVPSSIPTVISTYLSTLDVRAIALVLANLAIAALIYLPFVRAYERHVAREAAS
jgi:cellobiose-specific phosphotransferase system component IIC